jgi:hypothetical protein
LGLAYRDSSPELGLSKYRQADSRLNSYALLKALISPLKPFCYPKGESSLLTPSAFKDQQKERPRKKCPLTACAQGPSQGILYQGGETGLKGQRRNWRVGSPFCLDARLARISHHLTE